MGQKLNNIGPKSEPGNSAIQSSLELWLQYTGDGPYIEVILPQCYRRVMRGMGPQYIQHNKDNLEQSQKSV